MPGGWHYDIVACVVIHFNLWLYGSCVNLLLLLFAYAMGHLHLRATWQWPRGSMFARTGNQGNGVPVGYLLLLQYNGKNYSHNERLLVKFSISPRLYFYLLTPMFEIKFPIYEDVRKVGLMHDMSRKLSLKHHCMRKCRAHML
jgi:hypothetical protein